MDADDGEDWHPEQLKVKKFWTALGQGYLFSQVYKPITTALRQVTMRGIACTIERLERRVSIHTVDRNGVRPFKTIETIGLALYH